MKVSPKDCSEWRKNKLVNPLSRRKIQEGKGVYKNLEKACEGKASPKRGSPKRGSPNKQYRKKASSKKRSPKRGSPNKQYRKKDSPKKDSPKKDSPKEEEIEEGECFAKNFRKTYKANDFNSYCDPNTASKIKKALMLQLHPDRNPNCKKTATELFQTIGNSCQKYYQ